MAGLKGTRGGLHWDASAAWGKSNVDFYMYNTVNASLGPDQPCADDGKEISSVVPDQPCTPWFHPGVYDPLTKGVWNRCNIAVYGDLEMNDRDRDWTVGFAQRIEYFSDFGMTVNGKFAGRLGLSGALALRASVSSGFGAPTPGRPTAGRSRSGRRTC